MQTVATVVEAEKVGEVYVPILNYEIDDINYMVEGEPSEIEPELSSEVIINYNPENPKEFTIGKHNESSMFILIGILVFLCGIYIFFSTVKYLDFDADNSSNDGFYSPKKEKTAPPKKQNDKKIKENSKKEPDITEEESIDAKEYEEIEVLTF